MYFGGESFELDSAADFYRMSVLGPTIFWPADFWSSELAAGFACTCGGGVGGGFGSGFESDFGNGKRMTGSA